VSGWLFNKKSITMHGNINVQLGNISKIRGLEV